MTRKVFQLVTYTYSDDEQVDQVLGTFGTREGAEARRRAILLKAHGRELRMAKAQLKAAELAARRRGTEAPAVRAFLDDRERVLRGKKSPTLKQLKHLEAQAKSLGIPMNLADPSADVATARAWIKQLENVDRYIRSQRWPKVKPVTLFD